MIYMNTEVRPDTRVGPEKQPVHEASTLGVETKWRTCIARPEPKAMSDVVTDRHVRPLIMLLVLHFRGSTPGVETAPRGAPGTIGYWTIPSPTLQSQAPKARSLAEKPTSDRQGSSVRRGRLARHVGGGQRGIRRALRRLRHIAGSAARTGSWQPEELQHIAQCSLEDLVLTDALHRSQLRRHVRDEGGVGEAPAAVAHARRGEARAEALEHEAVHRHIEGDLPDRVLQLRVCEQATEAHHQIREVFQQRAHTLRTAVERRQQHGMFATFAAKLVYQDLGHFPLGVGLRRQLDNQRKAQLLRQSDLKLSHGDLRLEPPSGIVGTCTFELAKSAVALLHRPILYGRAPCRQPSRTCGVAFSIVGRPRQRTECQRHFRSRKVAMVFLCFDNASSNVRETEAHRADCHAKWQSAECGQPLEALFVGICGRRSGDTEGCVDHGSEIGCTVFFALSQNGCPSIVLAHRGHTIQLLRVSRARSCPVPARRRAGIRLQSHNRRIPGRDTAAKNRGIALLLPKIPKAPFQALVASSASTLSEGDGRFVRMRYRVLLLGAEDGLQVAASIENRQCGGRCLIPVRPCRGILRGILLRLPRPVLGLEPLPCPNHRTVRY
mmetsp:Transcript_57869/g.188113  ORF Transcript_57869/g.188113 Transcript_57869/m.188113 type:complete len:608 (-) Transcript_57869:659-2482(-)